MVSLAAISRLCCCRSGLGLEGNSTAKEHFIPEKSFYMNFKLLNLAEALPKIMRAKVRTAGTGDTAVNMAGKAVQLFAGRPKFGQRFSNKMADKMTDLLPYMLEQKGISLRLTKVHCGEVGFVVLRAEVIDIDLVKMLETSQGTEFAQWLTPLVGMARCLGDIDRALVPKVQQQMMVKLEEELPSILYTKARLKLMMICKSSPEQAEFFFDALAPHKLEIVFEILNRETAAPQLAKEHAQGRFGDQFGRGKLMGLAAGAVASHVAAQAPDHIFGKLVTRRLYQELPVYLAEAGVVATVLEGFAASDQSGATVLRCEIVDVDLDVFRTIAGGSLATTMAQGQHMLKLGNRGRSEVYEAIREYLRFEFPRHLLMDKGLQTRVIVRDVERIGPPELMVIEGLSDSDDDSFHSVDNDSDVTSRQNSPRE